MSWDWLGKLESLRRQGQAVVMVTVSQTAGSAPRDIGAKMLVLKDGTFFGTIGGGNLEKLALEDAVKILQEGKSKPVRYPLGAKAGQCCGGAVELLFEVLNAGPALYVFGAGHVGQAVARCLVSTPFTVHLIDDRSEWIHSPLVPDGVVRHACEWDAFCDEAEWSAANTFIAIMTHRHDLDEAIVGFAVRKPARYLGLIGSRPKWARFRQRLSARGYQEAELDRIRCPIGIRLGGGKAPQEIAISIGAELLKTYYAN